MDPSTFGFLDAGTIDGVVETIKSVYIVGAVVSFAAATSLAFYATPHVREHYRNFRKLNGLYNKGILEDKPTILNINRILRENEVVRDLYFLEDIRKN